VPEGPAREEFLYINDEEKTMEKCRKTVNKNLALNSNDHVLFK